MTKIFYTTRTFLFLAFISVCLSLNFSAKAAIYPFNQLFSGVQEVPPNATPGTGTIVGTYNDATNRIFYTINFTGLLSPTVAAHFHAPALPGVNAPVIINYAGFPLGVTSGTYSNSHVISDAQETQLLSGLWYSNIHTNLFPGGEIRAQVILGGASPTIYPFNNTFSGLQEVPPNASPATGTIIGTYNSDNNRILYTVTFSGLLSPTVQAHFHAPALPGVNAPVIIGYAGFPVGVTSGVYSNSHVLTDAQETQLLSGLWYSNIHTILYPGGEIRAQILLQPLPTFLNNLSIVLNTSCLGNDGNISIIPLSGTPPFMYSINGGMTYVPGPNAGFTFLNLGVGTYQLRLKDANGNESAIVTRTIVQQYGTPPTFLNSPSIVGNVTCPGRTDGTITIIPTSGGAPFMYSINGGMSYVPGPAGGFTFTGLSVGPYQLRLKSANGCESAIVTRTIGTSNPVCPPVPPVMVGRAVNKTDVAIEASPNPSRGQVRVQLQNFAASKAEVLILDSRGTIIQKSQVSLTKHNIINFDLSRNAPGLYFIKVVSTDGIHSSKILLQR